MNILSSNKSTRKKNKNGQGGIYQKRKNGKWFGRATDPRTGKRKETKEYNTAKEAQKALNELLHALQNNSYIDKSKATLLQLAKEYVEDQKKNGEICANTVGTKQGNIKRIERMNIANIPIQKVTVNQIKDCLYDMRQYSQAIIDKDYQLIKKAFELAVTNEILAKNPFDSNLKLKKPKSEKQTRKVEALTLEEQKQILKKITDSKIDLKYKIIILLSLKTGMRCGEILALKPQDIDTQRNVIHVTETTTRDERGHVTLHTNKVTKTETSQRIIPISEEVAEYLRKAKIHFVFNKNQLLFCNKKQGIITSGQVNDNFKRLCKEAGITKRVTFHMLRHTYVTNCVEGEMAVATLQKLVGHKSIKTTIDVYTDISNEKKKEEAEKQTEYLKEKGFKTVAL